MADEEQSQTSASDAAAAAEKPVIDMAAVTLEQLDDLLGGKGTAELPMVVNREEKAGASGATGPAESGPAETGTTGAAETGATGPAESGATGPAESGESGPAETGETETGATGPAETGATGPEASGATGPAASGPEDDKGDRFRYSDPTDRAVNALYRARKDAGRPITWAEAEKLVKGDESGASGPPTVEAIDYDKVVGDLQTEVTDIKKKLDDAGANEGVFDATISKLTQDLAEKTADLKLAQRDQRIATEQAEVESRRQAEQSAQARAKAKTTALEQFPDAGDDSTALGKAVSKRIAEMKNPNHPDHSILYADSAPLIIVRDVASEIGIQAKAKKAATPPATPPPATPPAVPPKSKVQPPSGAKTSVSTAQPEGDAKKYVEHLKSDKATLDELDAVFEPGGQQKTLAAVIGG
jgi:hypothetical protein